jgi:hypothetical protein
MQMTRAKSWHFILLMMLISCDPRGCNLFWQPNFYGYISREDLIRIPLIQPYELLTLGNLDSHPFDESNENTVSLLRPWPVFQKFEKDFVLPWYDPAKGIEPVNKKDK